MQPHFESWGKVWAPQFKKDIKLLESIQRRAVNVLKGLEGKPRKRVIEVSWPVQEKRGLRVELIMSCSFYMSALEGQLPSLL